MQMPRMKVYVQREILNLIPSPHWCLFLAAALQMARMKVYVQREILNHVQLSGHPSIVGFKEVGGLRTIVVVGIGVWECVHEQHLYMATP